MRLKDDARKMEIYGFVSERISQTGVYPTTDEIACRFSMAKSTVSKYMNRLINEGLLEKRGRYRITLPRQSSGYTGMPVVGRIACGKPILALEDIEGYIPIDEASLGGGVFFGLVAYGDSMTYAGISDGDVVYIRRQSTADDGDIVVALIYDETSGEGEATLKRFYRDEANRRYILHAENPSYEDIVVENLTIVGVAVKVLKNIEKTTSHTTN